MDASRELSVGELIEHLLVDSLIDAGHITGESVTIVQGTERHSFPYEQARTFLMGMVRGRSWNLTTGEHEGGVERPRSDVDREKGSGVVGEPAPVDVERGRVLDDLLAMAVDMGMICSAAKDVTSGTVRVELSSCETQMSQNEAIVFITECILNGLNALRAEVLRPPESAPNSQPMANIVGAQESPHRSASDRSEQRRQARSAGVDAPSRAGTVGAPSRAGTVGGRPNWEPLSRCMRTSGIQCRFGP